MKRSLFAILVVGCWNVSAVLADPPFQPHPRPVPMPAPLGTYVNGWRGAQAGAAMADQFVIYRQEWFQDGTMLGPYGAYHLQRIIERLAHVPHQVIIEMDPRAAEINAIRQSFVVSQLLSAGIVDAQVRVMVGHPRAEGLYGDEAARIFLQRFGGGQTGGTMGTGGGANGGAGFGVPGGGLMGGFRGY